MVDDEQFQLARSFIQSDRLLEARQILERLHDQTPDALGVCAVLGSVYWDLGMNVEAIDIFRHATTIAPLSEKYSLGLFHSHWRANRRDEALEEMKRFIQLKDSDEYRELLDAITEAYDETE